MGVFGIIALGLASALIWYFIATRARLDRDRDQHHLASLLISVAAEQGEVTRDDIAAFIQKYAGAQRAARLNHAVKLARTAVSGEIYDRVVDLAKGFHPG